MSRITGFMLRPLWIDARWILLNVLLITLTAAACGAPASPPTPTPPGVSQPPDFVTAAAAHALPALVAAEREAARRGDIALLAQLWAEDAVIIDGRGNADPTDDYRWQGRAAILDRYALAVFPSPPPPLEDPTLPGALITVDNAAATLRYAGDHWRFVYREGRWWLAELAYALE